MLRELDKYEAKWEAEVKGNYIDAIVQAFNNVKAFAEEATESGRSWAIDEALDYLTKFYREDEIKEILENTLVLLLC